MATHEPEIETCLHYSLFVHAHRHRNMAANCIGQTRMRFYLRLKHLNTLFHIGSCWPRGDASSANRALPPALSSCVSVVYFRPIPNSQIILIPILPVWRYMAIISKSAWQEHRAHEFSELPRNGDTESKGLQGHDRTLRERGSRRRML